jgi:cytochrome c553
MAARSAWGIALDDVGISSVWSSSAGIGRSKDSEDACGRCHGQVGAPSVVGNHKSGKVHDSH